MAPKPSLELFDAAGEFEQRHVRAREGRTLIVGSKLYKEREDRRTRYADSVGLDMLAGLGVDVVHDLETPADKLGKFAHVECISVLEHCRRPWLVAANIERLMDPGATLHFSVPFMWRPHAYPNDYFRYTVDGVASLFPGITWIILMYGNDKLRSRASKIPALKVNGMSMFMRTEVFGFGTRR